MRVRLRVRAQACVKGHKKYICTGAYHYDVMLLTLHQTLHNILTIHSKHAKCHKSLNSQYRCLYTNRRCLSFIRLRPSQNFPRSSTTKLVAWTLSWQKPAFTVCSCTRHKANVTAMIREKGWRTLFTLSPVLDMQVRPVRQLRRRAVRLAASYTRTSTDSDSTLSSAHLRIPSDPNRLGPDLFSLINPQQSV